MKILRNYVLKEVAGPFFLSLSVLMFIMIVANLIHQADKIIAPGVSFLDILKLFATWIPYLLRYALPISLLMAILLSFGRISSDNEILAMTASGFSLYRVIFPIAVVGLILSLFAVILNDRWATSAHYASRLILTRIAASNPVTCIDDGTFIHFDNHIVFVDEVKKNKLKGIKIFETRQDKPPRTIVAREGEFVTVKDKNIIKLKLIDGSSDEPDPDNPSDFYQLKFKTYYITLDLSKTQPTNIQKKPKDMNIDELKAKMANLKKFKVNPDEYIELVIEVHKKISLAFANLAFVIIGLPLAIKTKKGSKLAGFAIGLIIIILYYVLLAAGSALAARGVFLPVIGTWLPNIILITVGIVLIVKTVER
jgi:lipopolysaccharide export system permease protein